MEEQNISMYENLSSTRPDCGSNNCESSLVTLDCQNPNYTIGCPRTTSKDLCSIIPEQEVQQLKKAKLRKRANKKDLCLIRVVLFFVMLIALTSFLMVLLIMLGKAGPDCFRTTESSRQPAASNEREKMLLIIEELYDLKGNIQLYKSKVNNLTREIRTIRHKPSTSNQSQCTCPPGPTGPQGKQGPVGPRGAPGYNGTVMETKQNVYPMALNSTLCHHEFISSISHTSGQSTDSICSIRADKHKGYQITGVTCSTKFADEYYLYTEVDPASNITIYNCRCLGSSQLTNPAQRYPVKCYLHYWICRIAI